MQKIIEIATQSKGLLDIGSQVTTCLESFECQSGLANLFLQHTSASLLIQENADPTARADLEKFFDLLVPENQNWHQHTLEGPDDTTSHLKSALTQTSINIPIIDSKLALGTWQGIYLFEHRNSPHVRTLIVTCWQ